MPYSILIVDDDKSMRYSLTRLFEKEGYKVTTAENGPIALDNVEENDHDLVIMDIKMPGMNGLEVLKEMKAHNAKQIVIIMTAFSTTSTAIEATKLGAYDYIMKPFEDIDQLKILIAKALEVSASMKNLVSPEVFKDSNEAVENIIGKAKPMQEIYKLIGRVAENDVTVLLRGESGTGKELVSRAIYHHSLRNKKPFIAVNCAAIPDTLLESELFGHEKGSFTDATHLRIGKFEQANNGTIFLDEIGDMSLATQAKILRMIQEKEFQRVGGSETIKVNVRLIVATNRDLETLMTEGNFREDLYYRLNVVTITIPPLRERKEDIMLLAKYFINKFNKTQKRKISKMSDEAMNKLKKHNWPGNVRELENATKRAMVISKKSILEPEDFNFSDKGTVRSGHEGTLEERLQKISHELFAEIIKNAEPGKEKDIMLDIEKYIIKNALSYTKGNQLKAAKLLMMNRNTLRKKIETHGIKGGFKIE
ncbi:MAG: sigma-54 dependent transcriptional regulator [Candidatus Ancaeobacter aquaticus]|nr:sigma-54 dependent transcriptional regulator [Candidatus Ancaeobacter aquaticus]